MRPTDSAVGDTPSGPYGPGRTLRRCRARFWGMHPVPPATASPHILDTLFGLGAFRKSALPHELVGFARGGAIASSDAAHVAGSVGGNNDEECTMDGVDRGSDVA